MEDKNLFDKRKIIILFVLLAILIFLYGFLIFCNYKSIKKYNEQILPNIFIEDYDIGGHSYTNASDKIDLYSETMLEKKIKFNINGREYEYSLKDLGVSIDKEKMFNNIKDYQNSLNYSKKLKLVNNNDKKTFNVIYKVDEEQLKVFLNKLKPYVDVKSINGYFDTTNGVKYVPGVSGYSFNVDKNIKIIEDFLENGNLYTIVELQGDKVIPNANKNYESIDTMTSSFVTNFNVWEGTRPINLRTALSYINGAVVEPGEIFSYYKYAGPYNKSGYVFYYEFVGNGVCQIATTTYNAALLGGLEIVKRYPHAKKSVYVAGGLDATVASYSSGWNVDFQFKNTYKYPIYIKAYAVGGQAHVEFWSNNNAKDGKTYSTESVQIGKRGYTTYLHTYKDGKEISRDKITTTWYIED